MNEVLGALLRLDTGLARVVREGAVATGSLPALSKVAPPSAAIVSHLDRFMNPPSVELTIEGMLQPVLHSSDVLRPEKFHAALDGAGEIVDAVLAKAAPDAARDALQGLGAVLKQRQGMQDSLNYFRDMLIAG